MIGTEKKISIIVPAYNIGAYVGRCLESLLDQTYPNIEVIAIDDGSQDDTGDLLERYAEKYPQIIVIHQKNSGVTAARFAGIERATGDYIGFVDGDDTVDSDMFEMLLTDADRYGADIAHCGYQMEFPDGRIYRFYGTGEVAEQDRDQGLLDLLEGRRVEPGLCNKLYRSSLLKTLLQDLRMDRAIRINEDLLMNFLLFSQASHSVFRDVCKYHYTMRKGSASKAEESLYKLRDPQHVAWLLWQETQGSPRLRQAAYSRYIHILIRNTEQTVCLEVSREARAELRRQRQRAEIRTLSKKTQYMAFGAAELLPLYRIVRWCYDRATGSRKRYQVD